MAGRLLLYVCTALVASGLLLLAEAAEERPPESPSEDDDRAISNKVTYDGAQLFRIKTNKHSKRLLEELEESGVAEKWRGDITVQDIMVRSDKIEEVKSFLKSNKLDYRILIEDIQQAISDENPVDDELHHLGGDRNKSKSLRRRDVRYHYKAFNRPIWNFVLQTQKIRAKMKKTRVSISFQRYFRFADHLQFHDQLRKSYPELVTIMEIGNSVEGRPIKVIKISSGKPNAKAIWIDGGIHAREWISPAAVSYLISEFVENRASHGPHIAGVDLYIAPFLNPDGYEYSHTVDRLWRKNRNKNKSASSCSGTDLNRNWGYRWGGAGASHQPCKEIFAGSKAFSEPETAAVSRFVLANKNSIKAYVTFHSYGQYILYPWGYDRKVPPDYADLDRVARKAAIAIQAAGGPAYTVGNSAATLYAASGGADDWAKGAAGIKYTYTIELRDNGVYGFMLPAQFIEPTAKDALAAIKVIAEEVYNMP